MSVRADVETFRSIPIFSGCDPVHLQLLAFSAQRHPFAAGEMLLKQGIKSSAAFLVLSGRAELLSGDAPIGSAGPGAMLGEVAMIADLPSNITARASETLQASRIDRSLFMRLASEYPEFGATVFAALARKLDVAIADLSGLRPAFDQSRGFRGLRSS